MEWIVYKESRINPAHIIAWSDVPEQVSTWNVEHQGYALIERPCLTLQLTASVEGLRRVQLYAEERAAALAVLRPHSYSL